MSDISNFFIYKNGETSDESIFSRIWEFVDFFFVSQKIIFCLFFQVFVSKLTSWSKNFLYQILNTIAKKTQFIKTEANEAVV